MHQRRRTILSGLVCCSLLCCTVLLSAAEPVSETSIADELKALYEADQADRTFTSPPTAEDWQAITERDHARRDRVLELVRAGALSSGDDYYRAAMVLQHGEGSDDILLSHILSTVAGFKGHEGGRWLSAASLDRFLHRVDRAQMLGTQFVRNPPSEPWSQGAYDAWLPDSIRAEYGVRPLAEQAKRVEAMNQR